MITDVVKWIAVHFCDVCGAHAHEKLVELAKLCYDVIEDDLEERPARHSLGNLSARLRAILKEGKT